jgi:hypothetical protein
MSQIRQNSADELNTRPRRHIRPRRSSIQIEDDYAPPSGQIPRGDSPSDPSWIPSSAQLPRGGNGCVSPPAPRKRNATPDVPEEAKKKPRRNDYSANITPKDDGPKRKKRYNGYTIPSAISPTQRERRQNVRARPLKIRPLRSKDQPMEYLPGNEPKISTNVASSEKPQIMVQRNGAALPQKSTFDPWNLNSGGHQTGDGQSVQQTTGWKLARDQKLEKQYGGGRGGGMLLRRRNQEVKGQQSIADCFGKGKAADSKSTMTESTLSKQLDKPNEELLALSVKQNAERLSNSLSKVDSPLIRTSTIFKDLVIYIDGSTLPVIGDYHLRSLITLNGGSITMGLARKRVTHVILTPKLERPPSTSPSTIDPTRGRSASTSRRQYRSAGAGLAAGKVQKEIATMRGPSRAIKFVSPNWVIESIKAGKRLPEAKYADWIMAHEKQPSTMDRFAKKDV